MLVKVSGLTPRTEIKRIDNIKIRLGKLCPKNHFVINPETMEKVLKSARFVKNGACVACHRLESKKQYARKVNDTDPDFEERKQLSDRHQRLDDIKAARELGITLEEYLG